MEQFSNSGCLRFPESSCQLTTLPRSTLLRSSNPWQSLSKRFSMVEISGCAPVLRQPGNVVGWMGRPRSIHLSCRICDRMWLGTNDYYCGRQSASCCCLSTQTHTPHTQDNRNNKKWIDYVTNAQDPQKHVMRRRSWPWKRHSDRPQVRAHVAGLVIL